MNNRTKAMFFANSFFAGANAVCMLYNASQGQAWGVLVNALALAISTGAAFWVAR